MAAESGHALIAVPSGAEVWLQEELSERLPGTGLVRRYRFVMPALAARVPLPEADMFHGIPSELLDEHLEDLPLTAEEQMELDALLGELSIEPVPGSDTGEEPDFGGISIAPLPDGASDYGAPRPDELLPPDVAVGPQEDPSEWEDMPLPSAPDILMQDPNHRDIVWLCETYVLPQIAGLTPQPAQVVISLASAPSPFGSFDPEIVQLFEGFSIPPDASACIWTPL